MDLIIIFTLILLLLVLGVRERRLNAKQVSTIKYRVNVNGTRGKSTVTRLLVAALLEAGIPTVGKATGSKSCLLSFAGEGVGLVGTERELHRSPEGANIKEIKVAIHEATHKKAEALVAECMAVDPDYQRVFATAYLQSNVSIITNVLVDHLDILGPTLDEMAEAFFAAVAPKSTLVLGPGPYLQYFVRCAARQGITVKIADPAKIAAGYCERFSYPVFAENVALALTAAVAMGVDSNVAMDGMLKAIPDAGVLSFEPIHGVGGKGVLVNAFSANDPSSTMVIWHYLQARKKVNQKTTIVMNCRNDRLERAKAFLQGVLQDLPAKSLILIGEGTDYFTRQHQLPFAEVVDLGGASAKHIALFLRERCQENDTFFGIGNFYGVEEICKELGGFAHV